MLCVQHPSPPGPVIRQGVWYEFATGIPVALETDGSRYVTTLVPARDPAGSQMRIVLDSQVHRGDREVLKGYHPGALLACFLLGITLDIVSRIPGTKGFVVLPRRWVVERTFGWLGRWRRLSKDYEHLPEVSEAMVTLAIIRLMLHRVAHPNRKRLPARDIQNGV